MTEPVIFWFRSDLRMADNPALCAAVASGKPVLPVFILDDLSARPIGSAARWWLHHSLESLMKGIDGGLRLFKGRAVDVLAKLVHNTGAKGIYWNQSCDGIDDEVLAAALERDGVRVYIENGNYLFLPQAVRNKQGGVYKVFTPFYRACLSLPVEDGVKPRPRRIHLWKGSPKGSLSLQQLDLLPKVPWYKKMEDAWQPGEAGAHEALKRFIPGAGKYQEQRDFPGNAGGVSRLSPYLRWGEISPRQIRNKLETALDRKAAAPFVRQLVWREFSHYLAVHLGEDMATVPMNRKFQKFQWSRSRTLMTPWKKGLTGYPIVDAGMRQLWHEGWMHNRVRMIVASFLTKDLLYPWQEGEAWFWDTLVDADPANNPMGWQWVAGCGVDAAPYFRIFNPVSQSARYDPFGHYIRRYVPEIAGLPDKHIHAPWLAPAGILEKSGVVLGKNYPHPVVNHAKAAKMALDRYRRL